VANVQAGLEIGKGIDLFVHRLLRNGSSPLALVGAAGSGCKISGLYEIEVGRRSRGLPVVVSAGCESDLALFLGEVLESDCRVVAAARTLEFDASRGPLGE